MFFRNKNEMQELLLKTVKDAVFACVDARIKTTDERCTKQYRKS
jgi:hypothetical protein